MAEQPYESGDARGDQTVGYIYDFRATEEGLEPSEWVETVKAQHPEDQWNEETPLEYRNVRSLVEAETDG